MSYANHACPCTVHKVTDNMLCRECVDHLKDKPDMATFN